jgi:hypothetical protein
MSDELETAIRKAVEEAIAEVGLDTIKKMSMFRRNWDE